jgi:hypothetical protein
MVERQSKVVGSAMFDLLLKLITISSMLTSGIAIYITVRNNSRQVGAQIFLTYSDRIRDLRVTLGDDNYPRRALLEAMFVIFEFYSLRRQGYVSNSIWNIWESDITRLLNTASFSQEWSSIRERFDTHPDFVVWVQSRRHAREL